MGLFEYKIRQFIRSNYKPIPRDIALKWKRRINYFYIFTAWNSLFCVYFFMYRKIPPTPEKESTIPLHVLKKAKESGIKEVIHYQVKGFEVEKDVFSEDDVRKKIDILEGK